MSNGPTNWYDALDELHPIASVQRVAFIQRRDVGTDFHVNVRAAMAAADGRLSNVDHARRTYVDAGAVRAQAEQTRASDLLLASYRLAANAIRDARRRLEPDRGRDPTLGEFAASIALERLVASVKSIHLLYRLGHRTDADAVARVIVEQIGWAHVAAPLDDLDQIDRIKPSKTISSLKALYPTAGDLYGQLTETAHLDLAQHQARFERGDGTNRITQQEPTLVHGTLALLILADMWLAVWESSQARYLSSLHHITSGEAGFTLRPDRAFKTAMLEHIRRAQGWQQPPNEQTAHERDE